MPAAGFSARRGATGAAEQAAALHHAPGLALASASLGHGGQAPSCFDCPAVFFTLVSAELLPASAGVPSGALTKKPLQNFLMPSLSWRGHRAAPVCRRHCRRLSILEQHPSSRPASLALPWIPSLIPQLPGKRAQLQTALPLIGITFQVSFSTARFPPHLPIVSTLLIATFNSLCPRSPKAAAAERTPGPSTPRHGSLPQTKGQPNKEPA